MGIKAVMYLKASLGVEFRSLGSNKVKGPRLQGFGLRVYGL